MGTRCITTIFNESDVPLICLYRQCDGYPEGHGEELREFVAARPIISGIRDEKPGQAANGMACLAAQVVACFKGDRDLGGFYLYPVDTTMDRCGAEYHYKVRFDALGKPAIVTVTP